MYFFLFSIKYLFINPFNLCCLTISYNKDLNNSDALYVSKKNIITYTKQSSILTTGVWNMKN